MYKRRYLRLSHPNSNTKYRGLYKYNQQGNTGTIRFHSYNAIDYHRNCT